MLIIRKKDSITPPESFIDREIVDKDTAGMIFEVYFIGGPFTLKDINIVCLGPIGTPIDR